MFETNPLIQKLGKYRRWTTSTVDKIPLSMKGVYGATDVVKFEKYSDDSELITLDEINSIPVLKDATRTYRMNSLESNIIMIDIESHASDEVRTALLELPYGYAEQSMSGGIHLLVELPMKIIYNPKYLPILTKNFAKSKDWGFEVLTSNHFITFTKNELPNTPTKPERLTQFLDMLVDNMTVPTRTISTDESDINPTNVRLLASEIPQITKQRISDLDIDDFPDKSRYDWQASMILAGKIKYITNLPQNREMFETLNDAEIIETIYKITSKRLEHRDKHDSYRDNMPFLKYVARQAWIYVTTHN